MVAPTPFFSEGGCSARVRGEAEALHRAGARVQVLAYPTGREVPGLAIDRPRRSLRRMDIGFDPRRPLYDLELAAHLALRRKAPSVVHAHLHEGGLIARVHERLHRTPLVLDLQGSLGAEAARSLPSARRGALGRALAGLEGAVERGSTYVITSSPGTLAQVRRRHPGWEGRTSLVDDGVDLARFPLLSEGGRELLRARWRAVWGVDPHAVVAIYVGALSPAQGIDDLLQEAPAMTRELPELHLEIYGVPAHPSSLEAYRTRARRLGLEGRLRLGGALAYDQVPSALAAADLAISWKRDPFEGNGKMPLYLAAGLPVSALQGPVARRYLGGEGVPSGVAAAGLLAVSPTAAARDLLRLAGDPRLRAGLGREGRRRAERDLSWDLRAKTLQGIYAGLGA